MPLPSSTTSLVAGGGDDLDDDDRLSFALTAAASPSSSATSSTKSAPSRGSLSLTRPRCLGQRRRPRRTLGGVGAPRCTASPARCFPRLNLPRRDSHAPIAYVPLPGILSTSPRSPSSTARFGSKPRVGGTAIPPPPNPYRQAEGIPALGRLRQSKIFHGGAFDARGNYLRHASPWLKTHLLECSYVLDSVVADWLLPRTPKSFTDVANANFRLDLALLDFNNQFILTFESEFCFKTTRFRLNEQITFNYQRALRLLNLCGGSLIESDFPPLLRYGRDYLELRIFFDSPLFKILSSYIGSWYLGWDFVPKGRDYLQINNGPLIGLVTRSRSKAGTISNYTWVHDLNWILTRGHPYTVTIAKPETVIISDLLKLSLFNILKPTMPRRPNISLLPSVYAALPHIESQDTGTIVHLLPFNYFKVFECMLAMNGCIPIIVYYC
ncbi:hypothetical protein C8R43DRAFT_964593 [Mycena crocata]|nr:hypothetical protein C8R43DRAFT_964593 [Mycena crocata]